MQLKLKEAHTSHAAYSNQATIMNRIKASPFCILQCKIVDWVLLPFTVVVGLAGWIGLKDFKDI